MASDTPRNADVARLRRTGVEPVHRALDGRDLVLVLAAWAGAVVAVLGVAATTRIGPIVLDLSERHGVHLGDVVTALVCFTAAWTVTVESRRQR